METPGDKLGDGRIGVGDGHGITPYLPLGAGGWLTFWKVIFPALKSGILYGFSLTFARALGEFGAVLVVGGGIQGRTETATVYIFHALEERQYIAAYSTALLLGFISMIFVVGAALLKKEIK